MVQLRSVPLVGVPGMDFVYGVVKMYYASSTEPGYLFPLQGVFMVSTGTNDPSLFPFCLLFLGSIPMYFL